MYRKIIYMLFAFLLLSCESVNKEYSGLVVDKKYHEGYIRLQYYGKRMMPTPVPERYVLYVQDSTGKVRTIRVSEESYNNIEINEFVNLR